MVAGVYLVLSAAGMLFYSKVGKLRLRDRLLDLVPWRGDETVLDVGCGRGLLLVGAGKRLTAGKAVGVDIWNPKAVTGNRPEAVEENAVREGVRDRIEVKRGDARQLPFPEDSFDIVVSNFVLHEMITRADREQMAREMVRVLKPGGHLALVDFIFTGECVEVLHRCGIGDARRSRNGTLNFWMTAILSFGATQLFRVTGSKPLG